jgi:hypothetical protein
MTVATVKSFIAQAVELVFKKLIPKVFLSGWVPYQKCDHDIFFATFVGNAPLPKR